MESYRNFLDTIILSWFISSSMQVGLKIGLLEIITKMILYFFHEKLWYKINFGIDKKNKILKKLFC